MEKNNFDSLAVLSEVNAHRNACTLFIDQDGEPIASSLDLYPWSLNAMPWPRRRSVRAGRGLAGSKKLDAIDLCDSHANPFFQRLLESTGPSSPRVRQHVEERRNSPDIDPLVRTRSVHWSFPLVREYGPEYNDLSDSSDVPGYDYTKCCLKRDRPIEATHLQTFLQANEGSCLKHLMWANRSAFQLRRRYLLRLGIPASSLISIADSSRFRRAGKERKEGLKSLRSPSCPTMISQLRTFPTNDTSTHQGLLYWPLSLTWNKISKLRDTMKFGSNEGKTDSCTNQIRPQEGNQNLEMDFLNGWSF
uniref:Uncharacterized protein n=1 Tax=Hanusia phi TaxID=3032 RepID=A0A7S0NFR1_9CRYP